MSKIEKALSKAKAQRAAGNELVAVSPATASGKSIAAEAPGRELRTPSASKEIARMAEPLKLSAGELEQRKIIAPDMEDTRVANAFRQLRTKLLEKSGGKNCVIMVTSVATGHGSSFISLNLAVAFSFDESKTALLMDCNMQDPAFHELAYPDSFPGLSDFFESGGLRVEEIIHPTGVQRLRLIPAGDHSETGTEHFTSPKMRELLASVKLRYTDRFIIIDAPPIIESADSRILAEQCDFVLLVVPYGKVNESDIQAAAKAITPSKLAGAVFNNEPQLANVALDLIKNKLARKSARVVDSLLTPAQSRR